MSTGMREGPGALEERIQALEASKYDQDQYIQYQAQRIDLVNREMENLRLREELIKKSYRDLSIFLLLTLGVNVLTLMHIVGIL